FPGPGRPAGKRKAGRALLQRPPAHPHSHDAAIERLVNQELRFHVAYGAEHDDPLPQLGVAMDDQLARRELRRAVTFTGEQPLHHSAIEVDADVTDVTRADVMRPRVRGREMR